MAESDMSVPMAAAAGAAADALAPVRPGAAGAEAAGGEGLPAGLTTAEAMERLERAGPNAISETEPSAWRLLGGQLWGVIPGML